MNNLHFAPVIIGKLLNIGGMLQRKGNKILMPFGLNQQQYSVFFEIASAGKVKQKDMVNRLLLEKAHVSKVVKKLHSMGLITVTSSEEDKRSAWLELTTDGKKLLDECKYVFRQWHKEWTKALDEKQLNSIIENLSHLQAIFKAKIQGEE